jgi:hypothetical protein
MPFAFLYSRKNKVFTSEEQHTLDKICRNLGEFTKKKFTVTSSVEEDRDYGGSSHIESYNVNYWFKHRTTQTITCNYIFPKSTYVLKVKKVFALNEKESRQMLDFGGDWDYKSEFISRGRLVIPDKFFKPKDISGIQMFTTSEINNKLNFSFLDLGYAQEAFHDCTLLSYNSKWSQQIEKRLVNFFKKVAEEAL